VDKQLLGTNHLTSYIITADEAFPSQKYNKALHWFWLQMMFRTNILMINKVMLKGWLTMLSEFYSKSSRCIEGY
jgi:hypothetical protein